MLNWMLQGAPKKIGSKLRTAAQKAALKKAQAASAAKRKRSGLPTAKKQMELQHKLNRKRGKNRWKYMLGK
jgi:hypothetical protein